MLNTEKTKHLKELLEEPFRIHLAVPLLRRLPSVHHATDVHGRNESGADIVYFERDALNIQSCVAVQLKVGNIDLSKNGKGETFSQVSDQIKLVSRARFELAAPTGKHKPSKYIVITTGRISERAREELSKLARDEYSLNCQFIDGEKLIELIDENWSEYWESINKDMIDYTGTLAMRFRKIEDIVGRGANYTKNIDEIYVTARLQEIVNEKALRLAGNDEVEVRLPRVIEESEILNLQGNNLIVGDSGTGKRLLLRSLLFQQIKNNENLPDGGVLPFLIDATTINDPSINIESILKEYLYANNGGHLAEELDKYISNGILIIIDRLSRVSEEGRIKNILQAFIEFSKLNPKVRFIGSIRDAEIFETASLKDVKRWQVMAFQHSQVVSLVSKWFNSVKIRSDKDLNVIVEQLTRNVIQGSLPHTPLVFTLNLVLLENDFQTTNLADVLDKYVDLYLGKWDAEFNIVSKYDFSLKRSILSKMALRMLEEGVDRMPRDHLIKFFDEQFDRMGRQIDSSKIYDEIRARGLLVEELGIVRFSLYAFQEWFAGYEIHRNKDENFVLSKIDNRFWGQPIVFYAGLKRNCDYILENIYTLKEVPEFALQFYRSYLAGMIAVNADESSDEAKREAIRYSIYGYILMLRRLSFILRQATGQIGELYAGMAIDFMLYYGIGSPKLEKQYNDLFFDNINNPIINASLDDSLDLGMTEMDLPRLFLSSLMTRLGTERSIESMNHMIRSNNPYILMLLYVRLNHMIDLRLQLSPDAKVDDLRGVRREIHRKLNRNREETRRILEKNNRLTKSLYILPSMEELLQRPTAISLLPENSDLNI